jgi:hypothetical protein
MDPNHTATVPARTQRLHRQHDTRLKGEGFGGDEQDRSSKFSVLAATVLVVTGTALRHIEIPTLALMPDGENNRGIALYLVLV